ncbi:MAG TPA: 2-oxoglutarate dehydrogenase complex dihydrolipoyllysine-residue succinyltransferase [Polyangia bacterium]
MADLVIPKLGESISEAVIGKWLKNVGEAIAVDEPVVDLETDKVSVALPAPMAGVLAEQRFAAGDTVKVGEVIGVIAPAAATAGDGNGSKKTPVRAEAAALGGTAALGQPGKESDGPKVIGGVVEQMEPAPRTATVPSTQTAGQHAPEHAPEVPHSKTLPPSVRKALREGAHYEAPAVAPPSGGAAQARAPQPKPEVGEREEVVALTPLRKRIAQRLVEAQHTAAILTTFNEVDMSAVMALRSKYQDAFVARYGIKLGFMSFFVRACVESLKLYPGVNAEIRGDYVIYKKHYDFGIAVGGGKGLVVPVVRNVDALSLAGIEKEIARLAGKAKDNTLTLDELSGGTFSISNGGIYGSMMSTPLLNMPQTGILGMHNIVKRPMAVGDKIELRPMMYLALSYDHRVVDGREAVQFLVGVKERIEAPERLVLEV